MNRENSQNGKAVIQLSLDAAETLIVFDALKLMLRRLTDAEVNAPLEFAFNTADLLKQLQPVVVEIAAQPKEAGAITSEGAGSNDPASTNA